MLPCEDEGQKIFVSQVSGMEDMFAEESTAASISVFSTLAPKLVHSLHTNMSTIECLVDLRKRHINTIRNYI